MPNHKAVQLALRNRARSLVVCTTGSTSLSATATGYARAAGSFVTDGFEVGMELSAAGFAAAANNTSCVVAEVSALALSITGGRTPAAAAAGKTLTVGLPAGRAWENIAFEPTTGRPFIEEDFVPATKTLLGLTRGGLVEDTGLYVLRWYGLENVGAEAVNVCVDALLALFEPGSSLAAGTETVRIRGDVAPTRSRLTNDIAGWTVCTVSIPYRVLTINSA